MKVSCIIPTRNSEQFIDRSIVSVLNQSYHDIELIVVDNFSVDSTFRRSAPYVDMFLTKGPERTTQANYAIGKASGELIYLTGSDMTRDYDFIKECVEKIKECYDAIYMSVKTDMDVRHFWGKVKALERESYIGTFIESARFFKKSVWESLGGFDEDIIAMEEDFQHRLDFMGYKTGRVTAREYHLPEDDSLLKVFKKAFYYGGYMKEYLKKHKGRALKQLNPIRPNLKIFLKHPILLGGFIIYKLVQYLGGGLGCLLN
jgi:glycosyltransferase involved in cell wall biosynthesis